jgi:nucleoside-diphosphate-sugar epimerase
LKEGKNGIEDWTSQQTTSRWCVGIAGFQCDRSKIKMHVLILGGTGFIGPYVVKQLQNLGHEVTVFHSGYTEVNLPSTVHHIHCETLKFGNRRCLSDFAAEFESFPPDVVVDMIPMTELDAKVVVDTFDGMAKRVIAISSQDVYRAYSKLQQLETGPLEPVPLTEDAPLRQKRYPYRSEPAREPNNPRKWLDDYDKIMVEQVVMGNFRLPGTILRLPMVYGPGDRQHRIFSELKHMDDKRPAILLDQGYAQWRWTRGYVENVAWAICLAATHHGAAGCIYNVGESETLSIADWIKAIGEAAKWQGEVIQIPTEQLPVQLGVDIDTRQHLVVDTTKIRTDLGFSEIVNRTEAIQRTIAWERSNPPQSIDPDDFDYVAEDQALAKFDRGNKFHDDSLSL